MRDSRSRVPIRIIAATIGMVLLTAALPMAGILHVIGRDLDDGYRGRLKPDPTTGTDQTPVSKPRPFEPGDQQPRDVTTATHP